MKFYKTLVLFGWAGLMVSGCASSHPKGKTEKTTLVPIENERGYNFKKLSDQTSLLAGQPKSRGVVDGALISLATDGIKALIKQQQKKYFARFDMAMTDLQFYNNLSLKGPFDPEGIKFGGFSLVRTIKDKETTATDTAFVATFVLDTTNVYEMVNTSQFRLRLAKLDYRFPKAKVRKGQKVNLDFEMTISASYVNEAGMFYTDVVLGKFVYTVRNAPIDKNDPGYQKFYDNLKGQKVNGSGFLVPRSFGYYVDGEKALQKSYSPGYYSIAASVKESSKNSFIEKMIFTHADMAADLSKGGLKEIAGAVQPQPAKKKTKL
jgi:hypothetical protein